jgi:hypothetical protein
MKWKIIKFIVASSYIIYCCNIITAQDNAVIKLLPPETNGRMPLMKVLMNRKTSREFSNKVLPDQVLSNLLWAANGINRPAEKKRTAPSAMNHQEIDI